jgi:hypothetical protein
MIHREKQGVVRRRGHGGRSNREAQPAALRGLPQQAPLLSEPTEPSDRQPGRMSATELFSQLSRSAFR